jgi:hypothetical protein
MTAMQVLVEETFLQEVHASDVGDTPESVHGKRVEVLTGAILRVVERCAEIAEDYAVQNGDQSFEIRKICDDIRDDILREYTTVMKMTTLVTFITVLVQ